MTELLDALAGVSEDKICGVNCCTNDPIAKRNGRYLCAYHRDAHDHGTFGRPCPECDSRQWIETPDADSEATCRLCDFVTYDECVLEGFNDGDG